MTDITIIELIGLLRDVDIRRNHMWTELLQGKFNDIVLKDGRTIKLKYTIED